MPSANDYLAEVIHNDLVANTKILNLKWKIGTDEENGILTFDPLQKKYQGYILEIRPDCVELIGKNAFVGKRERKTIPIKLSLDDSEHAHIYFKKIGDEDYKSLEFTSKEHLTGKDTGFIPIFDLLIKKYNNTRIELIEKANKAIEDNLGSSSSVTILGEEIGTQTEPHEEEDEEQKQIVTAQLGEPTKDAINVDVEGRLGDKVYVREKVQYRIKDLKERGFKSEDLEDIAKTYAKKEFVKEMMSTKPSKLRGVHTRSINEIDEILKYAKKHY